MRSKTKLIALVTGCLAVLCMRGQEETVFAHRQAKGKISNIEIDEISGLIASARNPSRFWTHNDSGDKARIFLLDDSAKHKATYHLKGVPARDWEDIGIMERKGRHYLLVADIGDNKGRYPHVRVYLFEEPLVSARKHAVDTIPKEQIHAFKLKYENGPRDAESLFFDPVDERLYIISKRELEVGIYCTALPETPAGTLMLRKVGSLPHTFITSADISPDGSEVLVKNLMEVFYWKRKGGESIPDMLSRPAMKLPYKPEPQGEAITFSRDGSGYYTLSEKALRMDAILYFYKRLL
ncbi:hypothetical protein [Parapedobacter tibetensis]|uniref:hypothetical protein n=1 Tax=Parapedobacter tibetensis TaxID=2972951 RepID=UPI00214D15F5|nr:hypothetical protein [Parapedobacter tibetensis]